MTTFYHKLSALLCSAVVLLILSGCSNDDKPMVNEYPQYYFALTFVNPQGENLTAKIAQTGGNIVSQKELDIDWSGVGILPPDYRLEDKNEDYVPAVMENTVDKTPYISFIIFPEPLRKEVTSTITFTLISEKIFGDDNPHQIITNWSGYNDKGNAVCRKVTYDGKDYSVKQADLPLKQYSATIVVDPK